MDQLLELALQGAFFAVLAVVLIRYRRRPHALNRDVVLVFGAVAGLFAVSIVNDLLPGDPVPSAIGAILLLAQPLLTIRIIRHFGPTTRGLELLVLGLFVASSSLVLTGLHRTLPGLVFVAGYFVGIELLAGALLLGAARARIGTARSRLVLAAGATVLFALSILIAAAGSATVQGGTTSSVVTLFSRLFALVAGLGYLGAFAPPRWLRGIQQRAIAFELNQELMAEPTGTEPAVLWQKLAAAARHVTGARAAAVLAEIDGRVLAEDGAWDEAPALGVSAGALPTCREGVAHTLGRPSGPVAALAAAAGASTTIEVPLLADGVRRGRLFAFVTGTPLFVDDDLDLLSILAARTVRAIDREEALAERDALVSTLRRTNDELARASAAKSDFLAAMSHELRTPLNSIIGFSELLMAPVRSGDTRRGLDIVDHAGHIHGAGLQLLDLINEVLDLARIEAGRLDLHHETFDLTGLVAHTAESMLPLAERRGLRLDVAAPESTTVEADPGRVRQIVYNLLSNAIKFSPHGGTISIRTAIADGAARVTVGDEGPGIPADEHTLVFEAFAQGAHGARQSEGTGLGLALSRQLAQAHGGAIELRSEPGHGSEFTLVLPLVRPVSRAERAGRDGRKLVLIIEDDPGSVALLRAWLEPEGYAVAVGVDGEAGLAAARNLLPDAILLDILLPGVDGWDVLQQLRLHRRTRSIPILVVSVVADSQLGLALGAADYFVKPLERDLLLERLAGVTAGRAGDKPLVVLGIDADEGAQHVYRLALEGSGRLVSAATAAEARALAREVEPDVILLDLGLRDESAFALLAELKADAATGDVPVFALTSHPLTEEEKERLSGQVVAILEKSDAAAGLLDWLAAAADGPGGAPDGRGSVSGAQRRSNGSDTPSSAETSGRRS